MMMMGMMGDSTSGMKFGKGKGPAKKRDDDDTTNGDTSGRYIIEVW